MVSDWPPEAHSRDSVNELNAKIAISHDETLLTAADTATTERQIALTRRRAPACNQSRASGRTA